MNFLVVEFSRWLMCVSSSRMREGVKARNANASQVKDEEQRRALSDTCERLTRLWDEDALMLRVGVPS